MYNLFGIFSLLIIPLWIYLATYSWHCTTHWIKSYLYCLRILGRYPGTTGATKLWATFTFLHYMTYTVYTCSTVYPVAFELFMCINSEYLFSVFSLSCVLFCLITACLGYYCMWHALLKLNIAVYIGTSLSEDRLTSQSYSIDGPYCRNYYSMNSSLCKIFTKGVLVFVKYM